MMLTVESLVKRMELNVPLRTVLIEGFQQSGKVLSQMTGREIHAAVTCIKVVPLEQVMEADEFARTAVTICLPVAGQVKGYTVLAFTLQSAQQLVQLLVGDELTEISPEDSLWQSALMEAGNVIGSSFLNFLANSAGVVIRPGVPVLVIDMIGAILDGILAELGMSEEEVLLAEASIVGQDVTVNGTCLLLADIRSLLMIARRIGGQMAKS